MAPALQDIFDELAPDEETTDAQNAEFLPIEIEGVSSSLTAPPSVSVAPLSAQRVDITLSDGRRILVEWALLHKSDEGFTV